ncbi:MAG: hypothetical protein GXP52_05055 [Deltaproteobacteria bacterium]|nr:hypothetical protein [Deltaproteobacteria bacterium]
MTKSTKSCPHCGSTTHQKRVADEPKQTADAKLKKIKRECLIMVAIWLGLLVVVITSGLLTTNPNNSRSSYTPSTTNPDCYIIGYRFAKAAALAAKGMDSGPDGNLGIPDSCQDDPRTDSGIADGAASVR